jgi:hypothetical protein
MNRTLSIAAALLFSLAAFGTASAAGNDTPRVDRRQARQQERIAQGIHGGSLTPREAMRLERGQWRVAHMQQRFQRDGQVTGHERARLWRAQNMQSRHIHHKRHNRRHA